MPCRKGFVFEMKLNIYKNSYLSFYAYELILIAGIFLTNNIFDLCGMENENTKLPVIVGTYMYYYVTVKS